jgi:hypothetical protein
MIDTKFKTIQYLLTRPTWGMIITNSRDGLIYGEIRIAGLLGWQRNTPHLYVSKAFLKAFIYV